MSSKFQYQSFVVFSGNLGGKVSVVDDVSLSHEQETYPTTLLDANCMQSEFQTDRIFCVDLKQAYRALKLKFVKSRGYETYNCKVIKKDNKEEANADMEMEEEQQEASVPLFFLVNKVLYSIFSMLKYTSAISKVLIQMICMRTNYTNPTNSRGPSLNTREFCTARGTTMNTFLLKLWKRFCLNHFSQTEWKDWVDRMVSCCMPNVVLTFFFIVIAVSKHENSFTTDKNKT